MDLEPWDPLDHPARIEVRRQESDDSDAEGGLGNVTRVVLRPPGHSGKAKRGHLCFDASYEGGNLGRVDFISEFEYDLFIRPDTCNPRYRLWFNFVVDNVRADQRVIFNIVNLCKIKTLFRDGMTPLVKTSSRPKWQRLPGKYVYYHKSPEHRNHYILSFAFAFDREEDVYQFAFSFPYSYSRCQAHLELLEQRDFPFFRRDIISNSIQNRKLDVITISNLPTPALVAGKKPKVVIILARSHPGESPSSYVAQGLMDFLVSTHPLAVTLRDYVVIKIVPMMNPDGVFLGNLRSTIMGYDLNRHWNQVSPWSHPTLNAVKNYLIDLDANKTIDLDMVIDIHAHSSLMGAFIYGNAYDDVYRFERHILFPKLLAHNAEDYNSSHTMYNRDPNKAGTARRHLCEILKNTVNVYTLEVSFFGYNQPLSNSIITYNEDGYLRLGRNLARTFFDYYKATGIIPQTVMSTMTNPSNNAGDENERKLTRGASKPRPARARSRTKEKSREKSETRSPSGRKDAAISEIRENSLVREGNNEPPRETSSTVVKLSQLTRETVNHSGSSDSLSSDVEVPLKATRNGVVIHQQYIRRRSSGAKRSNRPASVKRSNGSPSKVPNNFGTEVNRGASPLDSPPSGLLSFPFDIKSSKVKKAAYQTFDFSILKHHKANPNPQEDFTFYPRPPLLKHSRNTKENGPQKIGGGGIVTQRKIKVHYKKSAVGGANSETETDSPCLTIIDFNMLIRKGLEGIRGQNTGQRGWASGRRIKDTKGILRNGGGVTTSGQEVEGQRIRRRNNAVRRRRAILLRGAVTDCSPWEEEDSSDSDTSILSLPRNLGNLRHHLNKSLDAQEEGESKGGGDAKSITSSSKTFTRRRKSPATPTLSPSPIFLPQ